MNEIIHQSTLGAWLFFFLTVVPTPRDLDIFKFTQQPGEKSDGLFDKNVKVLCQHHLSFVCKLIAAGALSDLSNSAHAINFT